MQILLSKEKKEFIKGHLVRFFFLLVLAGLLYSNVLQGEFISDDFSFIVMNFAVRNIANLAAIWQSFTTRFLVFSSFAINYALGKYNVVGYHVVNIVLHAVCSYLVYLFCQITLQTSPFKESALQKNAREIAFYAALIFLCHPIQTQAVAYIAQRATSMVSICYLLALILYVKSRLCRRDDYFWLAVGAMFLGIFCKELIITLPLMILVYESYFLDFSWKKPKTLLLKILPFICVAGVLIIIFLQDSELGLRDQLSQRSFQWNYFLTEINVLRTYLRLMILPLNQNHHYAYPMARSLVEPWTLFSILLLAGLCALAVYLFKKYRLLSFAIIWFFIATAVEFTTVCFVHRGVIYEHWIYLAMAGCSIGFAVLLFYLLKNKVVYKGTVYFIVILLSMLTYQRNFVWQNEITLWEDVVKKSWRSPIVYLGIGTAYQRKGMAQRALDYYQRGLQLFSRRPVNPAFAGKGGILTRQTGTAQGYQERSEGDQYYLSSIYNNIGLVYLGMGKQEDAILSFRNSYRVHPRNAAAYQNLAKVCLDRKQYREAIYFLKEVVRLNPQDPEVYYGFGIAYLSLGENDKAKVFFQKTYQLEKSYGNRERAGKVLRLLQRLEHQPVN